MPTTPASQPEFEDAFAAAEALGRGINLGNMLDAPTEGEWGGVIQESYFDIIREAGFDAVRVPIRWSTHADPAAPYTIDAAFFERVDQVTEWALARGLVVVLDMHHYEEMAVNPGDHQERFLALWKQIAEHYQDYPPTVFFELMNEPNSAMTAPIWNDFVDKGLAVIRASNPERMVLIGGVNWNNYGQLQNLQLPDGEERVIGVFHYYEPFHFTHQGAEWVSDSGPWLGTTWEGTDSQIAEVRANFDQVSAWSQANDLPVHLNEFGAYSKADPASRLRWTDFIAREAERRGFAWAYWEFNAGFGAYDPLANAWREDLLKALIP
jgi:endoglucanase